MSDTLYASALRPSFDTCPACGSTHVPGDRVLSGAVDDPGNHERATYVWCEPCAFDITSDPALSVLRGRVWSFYAYDETESITSGLVADTSTFRAYLRHEHACSAADERDAADPRDIRCALGLGCGPFETVDA